MHISIPHTVARLIGSFVTAILLLASGMAAGQLSDEELKALDERVATPYFGEPLVDPERRAIYVLTAYNETNFFIDAEGRYRGFEYDILKGYEKFINRGRKKASERYYLIFIPMRFEDILPALADGRGDIGAANYTVTDERAQIVDFADPYLPDVDEIVVTHRDGPVIDTVDDLSGRSLYILAGSSYVEHLEALNARFISEGKDKLEIIEAEPDLDHADILELINSGVVDLTVVDAHIAKVWTSVFPEIVLKSDVVVSGGGNIAWAVRKNIPEFMASVNSYVKTIKKGTLEGNIAFNNYYESRRWVRNPLDPNELAKLDEVMAHMKRYGERYSWDWIAVAAQAYQESALDQSKVSPAGAIGIMQVLPSTAAQKPISIKNIKSVENNIHAGVKYLSFVRKTYFSDPAIAPEDRIDFSWAAYNAGPTRIQRLRKRAEKRGYDPNKWFNNVEHMASESIGRETVDYVVNVNKYYIAYKFALERQERRLNVRRQRSEQAELAKQEKALQAWRRSYARD
jgi:membrane-bound lytic murein transglycosylase MltF